MRKIYIDDLINFMIKNVSMHILVSYDCRFKDSKIEFIAFDNKSSCLLYAEQNAREIITIINFSVYDFGYSLDDEIVYEDSILFLEKHKYLDDFIENEIEVI